jgi:hypothetical protein
VQDSNPKPMENELDDNEDTAKDLEYNQGNDSFDENEIS